jgi:hypothetical protein
MVLTNYQPMSVILTLHPAKNRDAISTVNIEETMSRKKQDTSETSSVVAIEPAPGMESDTQEGNPPAAKNWGPPYKAVFVSAEKGFELGENRRFNQRVFIFREKPGEEILAALKEAGFTYRAAEKAWIIPANAATRAVSDQMARDFAGQTHAASRQ